MNRKYASANCKETGMFQHQVRRLCDKIYSIDRIFKQFDVQNVGAQIQ